MPSLALQRISQGIPQGSRMQKPTCFTSSSIGPCPTLCDNFSQREESVSMTWDDGFHFDDPSWFRMWMQCEPPEIFPTVPARIIEVQKHYDLILAWNEQILTGCPNSVFITESACSWMDRKSHGSSSPFLHHFEGYGLTTISPYIANYTSCDVTQKRFEVAFICSSKRMFPGHILRQEIYERLPERLGDLKVFKHRSPPYLPDKRKAFEEAMFVITPENTYHNNYYSEKLVDCFIAKSVPLLWGLPNVARHFNTSGIIQFSTADELMALLPQLTPELYHSRMHAIEDNYQRALLGVHQWDMIERAIDEGIAKKHANPTPQIASAPIITAPIARRLRRS